MARGPENHVVEKCLTGFHSIHSALRRQAQDILCLWIDESRHDARMRSLIQLAEETGIRVYYKPRKQIAQRSGGIRHQGVVAICRERAKTREETWNALLQTVGETTFLLVLDRVQDPHNLGACIRTAECAGIDAIILPKDSAAPVNDTARRVAAGAADCIPIHYVTNLIRSLVELKKRGVWVVGTSDHAASSLHEVDLSGPVALVLGGEEKGIRRLVWENCDMVIRIPMAGSISSLNISVAAGVVLFEAKRQRDKVK